MPIGFVFLALAGIALVLCGLSIRRAVRRNQLYTTLDYGRLANAGVLVILSLVGMYMGYNMVMGELEARFYQTCVAHNSPMVCKFSWSNFYE